MANLPESATYDAGVYQLELTDPVQGGPTGVSNAPLKNLANRTAWLKSQIDGIKGGTVDLALYARLASPTFTGSPAAPTAALGDNTTKLATTAFVQKTLGGFLSKSIAGTGSVTLTAVEAGNGIIMFTGALTGNRDVIVPSSPTRSWVVFNNTTGAFTLTVKTASGTGVLVPQGKREIVYCDGTNVAPAFTDFVDVALEGTPTAPTPAQFDNDTSIATTAFVQRAAGSLYSFISYTNGKVLTASDVGRPIQIFGTGAMTVTLPLASACPSGSVITLVVSDAGAIVNIAKQGSDAFTFGIPAPLRSGDSIQFVSNGVDSWWSFNGTNHNQKSTGMFGSSLASNGYQKLPSGLIIQWGTVSVSAVNGNYQAALYPIRFPNACFQVVGGRDALGSNAVMLVGKAGGDPEGQVLFQNYAASAEIGKYFAIGY